MLANSFFISTKEIHFLIQVSLYVNSKIARHLHWLQCFCTIGLNVYPLYCYVFCNHLLKYDTKRNERRLKILFSFLWSISWCPLCILTNDVACYVLWYKYVKFLANAKERQSVRDNSKVYFTPQYPANIHSSGQPKPLKLRKIVDLVSSIGRLKIVTTHLYSAPTCGSNVWTI